MPAFPLVSQCSLSLVIFCDTDTLIISGTELDDSYVVTDGEILGGGLSVSFQNIESLMVAAQEGNGKPIHTK